MLSHIKRPGLLCISLPINGATCVREPLYARKASGEGNNRYNWRQRRQAHSNSNPDQWPWPKNRNPTPYDVLELSPSKPYTKRRYVELVKIYHPDLSNIADKQDHLPQAVRLERFHLVVAANKILSDPSKRAAYDRFGLGWRFPPPRSTAASSSAMTKWWQDRGGHEFSLNYAYANAYGRGGKDDASRNATWEDWERWHQSQDPSSATVNGQRQEEIYTRNSTFLVLVMLFAVVGGLAEINYANNAGAESVDMLQSRDQTLSEDIRRRRRDAVNVGDREERVKLFLLMRDPGGTAATLPKDQKVSSVVPREEHRTTD